MNIRKTTSTKNGAWFIVTADDFGMSEEVNNAIIDAHKNGYLTHTSLLANSLYFNEAVSMGKKCKKLQLGIHINLTSGKPVTVANKVSSLINQAGYFKYGFVGLQFSYFFNKKSIIRDTYREIDSQIKKLIASNIKISHIDSHRHIHTIPHIQKIIRKLAIKYQIPRIRVINESVFETLKTTKSASCLINGGIFKYLIIKFLSLFYKPLHSNIYFFSILHSCQIKPKFIEDIKYLTNKYQAVEIMLHPSFCYKENINLTNGNNITTSDLKHLKSQYRQSEHNTCYKLKDIIVDNYQAR